MSCRPSRHRLNAQDRTMKIIILGAGQVGSSLAASLVSEDNDITVVDSDAARLSGLQDRYDLRTLVGHAAHPSVLREAGIDDAELLVAVTLSDETNLVASIVAISGIELLKAFVNTGGYSNTDLAWKVGIHGMLVVSGVLLAWMDRIAASAKR
jgi:Trk K+ transport system NAD-binding subunit